MVDIKNVVVVGAGQMGNGIGQVSLMIGLNVTLVDIKDEFVDAGYANIEAGMKKLDDEERNQQQETKIIHPPHRPASGSWRVGLFI